MGRIWTSERRFRIRLDVELAACEAMVRLGAVPPEDYEALRKAFDGFQFTAGDVARIDEIRADGQARRHRLPDLRRGEGRPGRAPPAPGDDLLRRARHDARAPARREATALLLAGVDRVIAAVKKRAFEHRRTPMIGRTHGIHAEPITFGLKLAGWYDAGRAGATRIARAGRTVAVGKISGAVGTFANVDPRVEAFAMERLGLAGGEGAATQVVHRDRHAEFFAALALAGATLERTRPRSGTCSGPRCARPRSRSPRARRARRRCRTSATRSSPRTSPGSRGCCAAYALAALEDVALWHERDISHSSVERVIGPDATIALDFALQRFAGMIENLRVYPERMQENLDLTGGLYEAQRVLLALVGKGVGRQEGYVYVQRNAMKVWEEKVDFRTGLKGDPDVRKVLSDAEIDACFALEYHLKHVDTIFRRVFGEG